MHPPRRSLAAVALAAALALPVLAHAQTAVPVGAGTVTVMVAQLSPVPTTYSYGTDFGIFSYDAFAGAAPFTLSSTARLVDIAAGGCFAADFAGFAAGSIALIDRGAGCLFSVAYLNAQAAGATGVVFVNNVAVPPVVTMTGDPDPTVPVFLLSQAAGTMLRTTPSPTMTLSYSYAPTVVPEPATMALTGGGLLLLVAVGARRRATAG